MKQNYEEVSALQNYEIGQSYKVDKRVFHYSQATEALLLTYRLAMTDVPYLATNEVAFTALATTLPVGTTQVSVNTATFVGLGGAGIVAQDELKGGYVELWSGVGVNQFMWRKIKSNLANAGAFTVVTLDRPINVPFGHAGPAPALQAQICLHQPIYRAITTLASVSIHFRVAAGVPPVPVPLATPFFWLQTYGPVWLQSGGVPVQPLQAANNNFVDVYAMEDTIQDLTLALTAGISPQRIGHAMGAEAYGCNQIFLELDKG